MAEDKTDLTSKPSTEPSAAGYANSRAEQQEHEQLQNLRIAGIASIVVVTGACSFLTPWLAIGVGMIGAAVAAKIALKMNRAPSGARLMVSQVVPVWKRHLDAARQHAEDHTNDMLASFAAVQHHLNQVVDQANRLEGEDVESHAHEWAKDNEGDIQVLLSPMRQALHERETLLRTWVDMVDGLAELDRMAQIARAASAKVHDESTAGELNSLVTDSLKHLADKARHLREQHQVTSGSDKALSQMLDSNAHALVETLVKSIVGTQGNTTEIRGSAAHVYSEMESFLISFQGQDRLNQMLEGIGRDMDRLTGWVEKHESASLADARDWLAKLESTYTMEDQRHQLKGTTASTQGSNVQYF